MKLRGVLWVEFKVGLNVMFVEASVSCDSLKVGLKGKSYCVGIWIWGGFKLEFKAINELSTSAWVSNVLSVLPAIAKPVLVPGLLKISINHTKHQTCMLSVQSKIQIINLF